MTGGSSTVGDIDLQSVVTPSAALALLDQVEGAGGNAQSITAPGDLSSSLSALIASLAGTPGSGDCGPIVVHDETIGVQGTSDPNAQSDVSGGTVPAATLALFNAITNRGVDADATGLDNSAIGFASSGGLSPITVTPNYGADGPAAVNPIVYTLSIPGGLAANGTVYSGLNTTDGHRIYLFQQANGLIVGRVDTDNDNDATAADSAAFAISVNPTTGELYVAQYLSLDHPTSGTGAAGAHDEQVLLANDAIRITVTITDHDGDPASSQAISIGKYIGFADDGPSIDVTAANESFDPADDAGCGDGRGSDRRRTRQSRRRTSPVCLRSPARRLVRTAPARRRF